MDTKKFIKKHEDAIASIAYFIFVILYGGLIFFLSSQGVEWPDVPGGL